MIFSVSSSRTKSKTVWLDTGDTKWGWTHIKAGKQVSFADKGLIQDSEVQLAIKDAVKDNDTFVFSNPSENALEFFSRRGNWILKVIANSETGKIVTAMPVSGSDGDYSAQTSALASEIASFPESMKDNIAALLRRSVLQHMVMDFMGISKT